METVTDSLVLADTEADTRALFEASSDARTDSNRLVEIDSEFDTD